MPISRHPRHLSSLPIVTVPQPIRRAQSLPTRSPIVTLRFRWVIEQNPKERSEETGEVNHIEVQSLRQRRFRHREPVEPGNASPKSVGSEPPSPTRSTEESPRRDAVIPSPWGSPQKSQGDELSAAFPGHHTRSICHKKVPEEGSNPEVF